MSESNIEKVELHPPVQQVQISIFWYDMKVRNGKTFRDVHTFAEFLKANPILAEAVGYVPKERR